MNGPLSLWAIINMQPHRHQLLEDLHGRLHKHHALLLRPARTLRRRNPTSNRNTQIPWTETNQFLVGDLSKNVHCIAAESTGIT